MLEPDEKRTLIEHFLPVEEISREAKVEKNGRPPTFELHYWWTRKPLIAARAAIIGALLPADYDINKFRDLLSLGRQKRAHTYALSEEKLEQLKLESCKIWPEEVKVLDPFGGAGSFAFEALRCGLTVTSNDYNPLAYLIQKATIDYPRHYSTMIYEDVSRGLKWITDETRKKLLKYYPEHEGKEVSAYLWAWMARCPSCNFDNPLVGQTWLSKKADSKIYLDISARDGKLRIAIKKGAAAPEPTCANGIGRCISCGSAIPNDIVRKEILERDDEMLLALVLNTKRGKEYVLPSDTDLFAFQEARKHVQDQWNKWVAKDLVPIEEIPDNDRGAMFAKLYLTHWHRLLNMRQKLLFATLLSEIQQYGHNHLKDHDIEYSKAIMTYLAFVLGKLIDRNCRSTRWDRGKQIISSVVANRGIAMMWDHTEVNPFVRSSGTLPTITEAILDSIAYSKDRLRQYANARITKSSVSEISDKVDIIVTDPPYYDDVQYAEFSELYYVWEKRALAGFHNLGDVPRAEELSVGAGNRNDEFFHKLFTIACKRMYDSLTQNGLLVMFFAHSSPDAWDFVINALQQTGFRITATWPVHTENTNNPLARDKSSIMSSIMIVGRKRKQEKSGFIEDIQEDIEVHLEKRLTEFWTYGLRGADLTVSAMGATLDIITQYSKIQSITGEMKIYDILALVQKYVAQYVLRRYIKAESGSDEITSFYLYARLSDLDSMPVNTAILVARSINLDLKMLEQDGIIRIVKSGGEKGIQLLRYNERTYNSKSSLIDAVHSILLSFDKSGFVEAEKEMDNAPYGRGEIKKVLHAFLSLPSNDPEKQCCQRLLEKMGYDFRADNDEGIDNYF